MALLSIQNAFNLCNIGMKQDILSPSSRIVVELFHVFQFITHVDMVKYRITIYILI